MWCRICCSKWSHQLTQIYPSTIFLFNFIETFRFVFVVGSFCSCTLYPSKRRCTIFTTFLCLFVYSSDASTWHSLGIRSRFSAVFRHILHMSDCIAITWYCSCIKNSSASVNMFPGINHSQKALSSMCGASRVFLYFPRTVVLDHLLFPRRSLVELQV